MGKRTLVFLLATLIIGVQITASAHANEKDPYLNVQVQKQEVTDHIDLKVYSNETTTARFVIVNVETCTKVLDVKQPVAKKRASFVRLRWQNKLPTGKYEIQVYTKSASAFRLFDKRG